MDVLGPRSDLVGGEAMERLPHQFEVGVQVAGAGLVGQRGHECGVPEEGHELQGGVRPARGHPPGIGAAEGTGGQVGHRIGHEGTGDAGLGVTV